MAFILFAITRRHDCDLITLLSVTTQRGRRDEKVARGSVSIEIEVY